MSNHQRRTDIINSVGCLASAQTGLLNAISAYSDDDKFDNVWVELAERSIAHALEYLAKAKAE